MHRQAKLGLQFRRERHRFLRLWSFRVIHVERMPQHEIGGTALPGHRQQGRPALVRIGLDERRQRRRHPEFVTEREADPASAKINAETAHRRISALPPPQRNFICAAGPTAKLSAMPTPLAELSAAELSRYSRHILLGEIGLEGQRRLASSSVLIVGAGGLGSPAALYLAAAGIGRLGIADLDAVEDHNLQRQLLHDSASIGQSKVGSAAKKLAALNPHIEVIEHASGITAENALEIFSGYDVIVDGTDNFSARYLNNDAAFFAQKPLVFGSVFKFEGQASVFFPSRGGPCYRCLFPEPPAAGTVPGCGEAGVLGALCGVIGSIQALEAVKLVLGLGESLIGRLFTYDALSQSVQTLTLKRRPTCALCSESATIHKLSQPTRPARAASSVSSMSDSSFPLEISATEAAQLLVEKPAETVLIDVREPWETQICQVEGAQLIPMREIPERTADLPKNQHLLVLCHHGARSLRVTEFLRSYGFPAVTNVSGGIAAWADEVTPSMTRY